MLSAYGGSPIHCTPPHTRTNVDMVDLPAHACTQAANSVGYGGASFDEVLKKALVPKGQVDYFVELHIEQGPELEKESKDIGIVTAIAAPAALKVEFHGDGGHAGAQLMPLR